MSFSTLRKIGTGTVTSAGGQRHIEFTNIPSTFDDLLLVMSLRNNRSGQVTQEALITFNGSATGYSERYIRGNGSTAISGTGSGTSFSISGFPAASATASTFGSAQLYIPNYAGSTNKSVSAEFMTENNATEAYIYANAMLWSNTAAITSINIDAGASYLWVQYSSATLYGIRKS